jgi:hypothetical protein
MPDPKKIKSYKERFLKNGTKKDSEMFDLGYSHGNNVRTKNSVTRHEFDGAYSVGKALGKSDYKDSYKKQLKNQGIQGPMKPHKQRVFNIGARLKLK